MGSMQETFDRLKWWHTVLCRDWPSFSQNSVQFAQSLALIRHLWQRLKHSFFRVCKHLKEWKEIVPSLYNSISRIEYIGVLPFLAIRHRDASRFLLWVAKPTINSDGAWETETSIWTRNDRLQFCNDSFLNLHVTLCNVELWLGIDQNRYRLPISGVWNVCEVIKKDSLFSTKAYQNWAHK